MPPFSCNFLARKSLSSLLCKTFEAKIQSTFLLNKSSYAPKNYIEAKIRKLTFFGNFQTQCFYAFLEWIEALWSQKQSFKNSVVEVPIPFPKYTRYLHHLWYEVDKMTCQRKAEWCANFLSTWKVQKSAFHCFVINPQLAPGGLRMPISILCFGKGPCAAALRLRPFISRLLKGRRPAARERRGAFTYFSVPISKVKLSLYEKKIFHQCIISDSWAWAFNEIFSTVPMLTCDDDQWDALEITAEREKLLSASARVLLTTFETWWFILIYSKNGNSCDRKSWHWPKCRYSKHHLF